MSHPLLLSCCVPTDRLLRALLGGDVLEPVRLCDDPDLHDGALGGHLQHLQQWTEGDKLKVRGYFVPFYKTQTWTRGEVRR